MTTGLKSANRFDFLASADGILGAHCTGEFSDLYWKSKRQARGKVIFSKS